MPLDQNIFINCIEHKNPFIFRCLDCNKSLCFLDTTWHNDEGHQLEQLRKYRINDNEVDKIKNTFEKQKKYFEKIKAFNNNLIQNLENDIQIKERIINNYFMNKSNYNSIMNLRNIYINNNEKYENILADIFSEKEKGQNISNNNQNQKNENSNDFINNYLSTLYYGLMINKEEAINNSLINDLEKKVKNFNLPLNNYNINLMNIDNNMQEENIINYNKNIFDNNKNNSNFLFNSDDITQTHNEYNLIPIPKEPNNYFSKIYKSSNIKTPNSNINNEEISYISLKEENIINKGENISENKKQELNIKFNNLKSSISSNNKIQKNIRIKNRKSVSNNKLLKNSSISFSNSQSSSKRKRFHKMLRRIRPLSSIKVKKPRKNNNQINNMILLKSGNVAVSKKEAVEIYNLKLLDFSDENSYYNNQLIQTKCLLQRINLIKGKKISYVFECYDGTLLCSTYAKIFRIKLTNNDLNHDIISYISLEKHELPTKIISLGNEFLVLLIEQGLNCKIKIYKNNANFINQQQKFNNSYENKINNKNNSDLVNKEIEEDESFELLMKNINELRRLWVSIHPIEKKVNNINNNLINNKDNYLYEFIATSNLTYDYGKDVIAFFGIKNKKKGKNKFEYSVEKIKEIKGISCSTESDTICQISDKYLCIGLQNHNLDYQNSGFAFIDIYSRNICRYIEDQEISCIYYNAANNLLYASMEVRDPNGNYFTSKIFEIIFEKDDKGSKKIGFNKIIECRNLHTDTITSIVPIKFYVGRENINDANPKYEIIFVTSSKDANLEIIKIKNSY